MKTKQNSNTNKKTWTLIENIIELIEGKKKKSCKMEILGRRVETLYNVRPIVTVANCSYHMNLVIRQGFLKKYLLNTLKCLSIGTPKTINFPFVPNGKLMVFRVPTFEHIIIML